MPGIMSGAFWLSPLGAEEQREVYYQCSKCKAGQYEDISDMGDLQVQQNLTAAADFNFVCEDRR